MNPQGTTQQAARQHTPDKGRTYNADLFTLVCLDGWQDKTVFTLAGPVEDDIQHSVVIAVGRETPFTSVREFAEWQIATIEEQLKGSRLLKKGGVALSNGTPAYQAIFVWYPIDSLKVYQEQIFVLSEGCAYTLTATFSRKTRKTLGPRVERMMLSFEPVKPRAKSQGVPR